MEVNSNRFVYKLANRIGMDGAIAYSSGSRIVGGIAGVISIVFITTFLSGVEQGFYYTFGSLLALQVFFELGLTSIMTQFVAHEVSHLELSDDYQYIGEERYKSRLASLIQFCVKWYTVLGIIVFVFLFILGFVYFNRYGSEHDGVDWQIPWILICVGTAIKLFQSPFISIYMGLGKVKEMSKIGFYQQIIIPLVTWAGLAIGYKLYVVGIGYLISVIVWQVYVHYTGLIKLVTNLWKDEVTERISYFKEIFPFQWKIALSWISGYFVFQLFNPVLFATEGAVIAGQMGMTLQALNAIQSFSFSWLSTKVPLYSRLIALNDYKQLDSIFNKTLKQMTGVCAGLLIIFLLGIVFLHVTHLKLKGNEMADRFLDYAPLLLMLVPVYTHQYVNSWATYLRCHKKEPFLVNSVTAGVLSLLSTFILGNLYGLYGVTIGYFIIEMAILPWSYHIFVTCKKKWHGE